MYVRVKALNQAGILMSWFACRIVRLDFEVRLCTEIGHEPTLKEKERLAVSSVKRVRQTRRNTRVLVAVVECSGLVNGTCSSDSKINV